VPWKGLGVDGVAVTGHAEGGQESSGKQGEGLLNAMKQVPAMFFQEDFMLERCPVQSHLPFIVYLGNYDLLQEWSASWSSHSCTPNSTTDARRTPFPPYALE
jgi:hypothetical protein